MPLTEAEIIRATQDYIARNHIVGVMRGQPLYHLEIIPALSVLLAYEEEIRKLHEEAN